MPKVEYTNKKGLVQSVGSGFIVNDEPVRLRAGSSSSSAPSCTVAYIAAKTMAATGHTLTIAELKHGILHCDPTADRAWVLPTATLLLAGLPGYAVGDCIEFSVINTGTATADEIITLTAGSGGTLVGYGGVLTSGVAVGDGSGSGFFRIRVDSSTAYTCYRLA